MGIDLNKIVIILMFFILGIFIILLFHVGRHTKSNIYLAIYFISQILGVSVYFYWSNHSIAVQLGRSVCFAWGACFYLFVYTLLNPSFVFRFRTVFHFLPAVLVFIFLTISENQINNNWFRKIVQNREKILGILFNLLIISYNIAALYKYYIFKLRQKFMPVKKNIIREKWLNLALFGFAISCFIVQLSRLSLGKDVDLMLIGNSAFLLYFIVLFYVAIVNRTIVSKFEIDAKYKNSPLTVEDAQRMLKSLDELMITGKPFVDPDLNLRGLASSLKISERYLSQIINEYKNQNFSDFINSCRIQHAMELLKKTENINFTILGIMFDSGFSSKTTFNIAFKKFAGCTPVEYKRKNLKQ
jgi:AraC-like DNA-binding protein